MNRQETVVVPLDLAGVRADRVLAVLTTMSRSASRRLIEAGLVSIGGLPIDRATLLSAGDVIEYPTPVESPALVAEDLAFSVVYESDNIVVVDKPSGLVVHPGAGHDTGTLVNGLIYRFPELQELGEEYRWGLVHRLDRDTSGLLLVARTPETHGFLQHELKERRVGRTYVALVSGKLEAATGTIDAPIGRDPARPTRMAIVQDGRSARTHYRRLAEWPEATLVQVELETGRTHQIRVHFSSIGLGLVGDPVYGRGTSNYGDPGRVWLHAIRLRFPVGDGDMREVEAPLPIDLQRSLGALGTPETGRVDLQ
jgi:23S rRNA pseudouridine1911/1915/1917 synthase